MGIQETPSVASLHCASLEQVYHTFRVPTPEIRAHGQCQVQTCSISYEHRLGSDFQYGGAWDQTYSIYPRFSSEVAHCIQHSNKSTEQVNVLQRNVLYPAAVLGCTERLLLASSPPRQLAGLTVSPLDLKLSWSKQSFRVEGITVISCLLLHLDCVSRLAHPIACSLARLHCIVLPRGGHEAADPN